MLGWLVFAPLASVLLDHGRHWILIPLVLAWLWLLRGQPARLAGILSDLRAGTVDERDTSSVIVTRRGIGLFAPTHTYLQVDGRLLDADAQDSARLYAGQPVRVRSAARSGLVLDVRPEIAAGTLPAAGMLNERDRELLTLIAGGLSDKLIARELELSPGTVRTYNSVLYRKLGASSRREAIEQARKRGLLAVD